jgi:tetratricopeptide (TPR) repeat protein
VSGDLDQRLAGLGSCDDVDELVDLGCDLADADRHSDAEGCFRRAASLGSAVAAFDLGNALAAQRRWEEAVPEYQRALEGGVTDAWLNLGLALEELGDADGAVRAFRGATQAGDSNGALALAFSLRDQGERHGAKAAAREAALAGSAVAVGVLACWEWDETRNPALEPTLREGANHYPGARVDLADLLQTTGRVAEARALLERGAKLGERESWLPLGNLYWDELGDLTAAEGAYRRGIAAGDTYCHHNLGLLLQEEGVDDAANEQFRLGAAAGDEAATLVSRDRTDDHG